MTIHAASLIGWVLDAMASAHIAEALTIQS
jgi:hypothetical protein